LDKQGELESDPACNNLSVAAKHHCIDEDEMQIDSEVTQYVVDKSDLKCVKMHCLNNISDHIRKDGNQLYVSSELSAKAMMDVIQAYRQWNCHEAAIQILKTNAGKELFQYPESNANTA
jgi:hypothetical protein